MAVSERRFPAAPFPSVVIVDFRIVPVASLPPERFVAIISLNARVYRTRLAKGLIPSQDDRFLGYPGKVHIVGKIQYQSDSYRGHGLPPLDPNSQQKARRQFSSRASRSGKIVLRCPLSRVAPRSRGVQAPPGPLAFVKVRP